jgi:hypothetical protein
LLGATLLHEVEKGIQKLDEKWFTLYTQWRGVRK